MSKRSRAKQPNLPKATLERARKQAGLDPEAVSQEEDNAPVVQAQPSQSSTPRRRKVNTVQLERSRQRGELEPQMIREILANPTEFVSEAQLRQQYQHVLIDLRNMGLLSAALMVLLVALAQFI